MWTIKEEVTLLVVIVLDSVEKEKINVSQNHEKQFYVISC